MDDLDAHPSGLDLETDDAGNGSKLPLLALIVALIGIVIGIAGIYMAAQATRSLRDYQESQATRPDTTAQRLADLEAQVEAAGSQLTESGNQLRSLEERLEALGSAHVALQRSQRETREQTQRSFDNVSREIASNRSQINDALERFRELVQAPPPSSGRASAAPSRDNAPAPGASGTEPVAANGESGVHSVAQGDTLSSIAARYGVSLSQVMSANPDVDPRRMRIGQQIIIPQP